MSDTVNPTKTFPGVARLLAYFRMAPQNFSRDITTLEQAMDLLREERGLFLIPVSLEGDWPATAAGPFLAQDQQGLDVALLPDWRGRYYFYDEGSGKRVRVTARNSGRFSRAYSVVRDFPGMSVKAAGVLGGMFRSMSWYEGGLLILWGLLGGALEVLLAGQIRSALSGVILTAEHTQFWRSAGAAILVALVLILLVFSGRQVVRRVAQKAALATLVRIGGRLYEAEDFTRQTPVAAGLTDLRGNGERVMTWFLLTFWQWTAVFVILPFLWDRSPAGCVSAVLIALVLYTAAVVVFLRCSAGKTIRGTSDQERRAWLAGQITDRRLGLARPFPAKARGARPPYRPGAAWPLAALLALPLAYFMMAGGHSAARLIQTLLLYLPVTAFSLGALLGAADAGQSMAEIRCLLPMAQRTPTGHTALPPVGSVFELKDVSFCYPGRSEPVLRGINLRLHPGELVGILGGTGAGKTTLAYLMTGLLAPTGGNIYYGGIELARYNGEALRRRVACERGEDILLCKQIPARRDGRACVVFSCRENALEGCDRVLRLENGTLTGR